MKHDGDAAGRPSTAPPAPPVARGVFPSGRLDLAQQYADLLAVDGTVRGLIGPREAPRLWERHLVNCALLAELVPQGSRVADIGSGAGLPGLVLAVARPDLRVTLVEPLLRRTTFLEEAVERLGLGQVEVVRARADALHGRRRFDVVTSRAVAPLDRLLRWSMPLVEPRGAMVAMKGSSLPEEVDAAAPALSELGCAAAEILVLGEGLLDVPTYAVRVAWADPGQVSWPTPDASSSAAAPAARRGRSGDSGRGRQQSSRRGRRRGA